MGGLRCEVVRRSAMRIWQYLSAYPPTVVRLCARRSTGGKHVAAMSSQEVALSSGLSAARVAEISWSLTWDEVTISETRRFCAACNFDPTSRLDRDRQARYVNSCRGSRRIPHYLRSSPYWETEFVHLIRRLQSSSEPSIEAPISFPATTGQPRQPELTHAAGR